MFNKKFIAAAGLALIISGAHAAENIVVQLGAFHNAPFAKQQMAKAALIGVQTQVIEMTKNNKTYYLVQTQPMSQKDAEHTSVQLNQNNITAIIVLP